MGPILVGLDGSAESAAALRWGAWFADRTGRALHVAHAWQHGRPLEALVPLEGAAGDTGTLEDRLRARVAALVTDVLGSTEAVGEILVVPGQIATALLTEGARHPGTLLVVGARGAGGALRSALGSVATELTECPSQPVVVVPRHLDLPGTGPWTMVVGIDGSTGASRAVRWAASTAARAGAHVVAVHAAELPVLDLTAPEQQAVVDELRQRLDEEWCAPLRRAEVPHTTTVEAGRPDEVIHRAAEATRPTCVVLGSRGLGGLTGRLLGSVTHRLIRELDWPTVVIPGPRDCIRWPPEGPG